MYYAMQLFFGNGGGPCYIVSVGLQTDGGAINVNDLIGLNGGLGALKKKDEPTLILFPDATKLASDADFYDAYKQALLQCQDLGDRFTIIDLYDDVTPPTTQYDDFRDGIGSNNLKYGAAYTPWLKTTLTYSYHDGTVTFEDASNTIIIDGKVMADLKAVLQTEEILGSVNKAIADVNATSDDTVATSGIAKAAQLALSAANVVIAAESISPSTYQSGGGDDTTDALNAANAALATATAATDVVSSQAATAAVQAAATMARDIALGAAGLTAGSDVSDLQDYFTDAFEASVRELISKQRLTMPPSSAIAGVYATVDDTRGVWKAPANVSLNMVSAPVVKITNAEQDGLNADPSGKSINAIRTFTGKGILVWGARTLAGNDNEWRYINVRRFFNMAEESIKKATEAFVFEPNDANTWVKVRAMIENFLVLQWRAGALAGATPEEAFYVRVGLGTTMTAIDILEGRMNVEIGMAVVRPAEFIILKFSHKMQES
ncbi:MAG: phage tail sheath family protein [Phaeodactylibacter sp.]|nr:phage tail sheath family protein [Phaeodactylibacter sp.]